MPPRRRRRALLAIARVAGVALLVWLAWRFFRGVDWRAVARALAHAAPGWVIAATAANLVQVVFRAACLGVLLAPTRRVGPLRLARYQLAMYAANNVLPARAGELVRIYLLRTREGVPVSATVAISLVEKVLDAIALLVFLAPVPWLMPSLPRSVAHATWGVAAVAAIALGGAFVVARRGQHASGRVGEFARGAGALRRPLTFAAALALALASYAVDAAQVWLCLAAVGLPTPYVAGPLVLLAMAVALSVPPLPGGLGAMEVGAVAALHLLGMDAGRALAFGVLYHATQAIPVTLLGLGGMRVARAGAVAGSSEIVSPTA